MLVENTGETTHSIRDMYHVLSLSEDGEQTVVPLLNVNVQESAAGEGATAGAANIPVQGVVVVLVLLQSAKDSGAGWDVTGER